jgi:hypothetical protein
VLADVTTSIVGGVREPVTRKVDREQSVARERGEEGCPGGGGERDTVEQNHRRAAAGYQQPHARAGVGKVEKGLLDLGTDGAE